MNIVLVSSLIVIFIASSGCTDIPDLQDDLEEESATVMYVIDGDTIYVELADGSEEKVRILGIDTPETNTQEDLTEWDGIQNETWLKECGQKATNTSERWMSSEVTLIYDTSEGKRDYYDRLLAYVETSNGTDIGEILLKKGLARAY
ncbi:MAG: thermonuclease family protein, partial [Thermoplasmatota archaeon]